MPDPVQRRRTRGWRMPPNTVYVGRPTRFGNPFPAAEISPALAVAVFDRWLTTVIARPVFESRRAAILANLHLLRGKNLACWCPLDQPCHRDVLLRLANGDSDV